jgi:hypothetical protein
MPASVLLFAVTWGGLSPETALERALDAVEPPPALRATFRATLASGNAVRRIEYDPYAPAGEEFKVTMAYGEDEELDAVVQGWKDEGQADCRIFADDLRPSLGEARLVDQGQTMAISFRHKVSANDGPIDREFSSRMTGRLSLDPNNGYLSRVEYSIEKPVKLDDGTTLNEYNQVYDFGYSERWGVSYVRSYQLEARGGRWGMSESRVIRVTLNDVAFGLAGDADQEIASKSGPAITGFTAQLR